MHLGLPVLYETPPAIGAVDYAFGADLQIDQRVAECADAAVASHAFCLHMNGLGWLHLATLGICRVSAGFGGSIDRMGDG